MSEFKTDSFLNAYATAEKTKLVGVFETVPAREQTAEMKVFSGKFTTQAGSAAGDKISWGRLPKGVKVIGCYFVATGMGLQLDIGFRAANKDPGVDDTIDVVLAANQTQGSLAVSNQVVLNSVVNGVEYAWDIVSNTDAITANGEIELVIMYTEM